MKGTRAHRSQILAHSRCAISLQLGASDANDSTLVVENTSKLVSTNRAGKFPNRRHLYAASEFTPRTFQILIRGLVISGYWDGSMHFHCSFAMGKIRKTLGLSYTPQITVPCRKSAVRFETSARLPSTS
jgi:hypothetical protein